MAVVDAAVAKNWRQNSSIRESKREGKISVQNQNDVHSHHATINVFVYTILILGNWIFNVNYSIVAAEHLLSIISTAYFSVVCTVDKVDPFEDYFRIELNQVFVYFEYSPYLAFFAKMLNLLSTFMWTYMDLFVMVVSVGLSTQFKKINRHLMKFKGQVSIMKKLNPQSSPNGRYFLFAYDSLKYHMVLVTLWYSNGYLQAMSESYWIDIRYNYRSMCKLCESIDDAIGPITIVSFANNLYFVCVQLLKSIK